MKEIIANGWTRVVKRITFPTPRYGRCDDELKRITICKKKNRGQPELIDTIVHEEIHAVFPEFNEREARSLTDELLNVLTIEQKKRYLDLYGYEYVEEFPEDTNLLLEPKADF